VKETGFDKILKDLIDQGLVYIGTSAGSILVGPTIDSSSGTENIPKEELKALGLVPFVVKSHYIDENKDKLLKDIKNLGYPIHILRDGEGIFCENGECRFIGDNSETILE